MSFLKTNKQRKTLLVIRKCYVSEKAADTLRKLKQIDKNMKVILGNRFISKEDKDRMLKYYNAVGISMLEQQLNISLVWNSID